MSKVTKSIEKEFQKFLNEKYKEGMSEEERENLITEFMCQYNFKENKFILNEKTAETSDNFLELAEEANDEKLALKYARKALKLDKDNLDAEKLIAELVSVNQIDMLKRFEKILKHGDEIMLKNGYMNKECIGSFWSILETRPYIRVKHQYMNILKECGMLSFAISECEDMIKLCENDNLGVRHILMALYAFTENEEKALTLYKKYSGYEETQILVSLSILYYRKNNLKKSLSYLKKLEKINKDTKKFFKDVIYDKIENYIEKMSDFGYKPYSGEELFVFFDNNSYLFTTGGYFEWAYEELKNK
ncbi:hypothetical protein LDK18_01165 [Fusobacterium nucleatum subsp. nucleatum ATCC 23726]|uniref:Tetratricopeptide repeat protein n=2 Tax=Fusobacterium nucleatum TaxID=851 RepID=D5RAZ4_FUSN2|nr:hypothetical protein [Fusobacterium nucleatum]AVQ22916.1 hypothetical protein C4N14_04520 [Fusobacterium nucleatum subsp. nucleatum ATCC 23726]EFG96007.1 hypothetical protein HMPREF0397_0379 [Fusobacterium nucleatum subsp. nucleatum ATCC 23726]